MDKKRTYRIRNWREYNRSLIERGNITLWFEDAALSKWVLPNAGDRGRPKIYSDDAILCALMVKAIYHLPLRALEGFLHSMIVLLSVCLPIPSYTQICRRASRLGQTIKRLSPKRNITDIVFDSSGLKVFGEGEWKVRQHGKSKRRIWRKIHLGAHLISPPQRGAVLHDIEKESWMRHRNDAIWVIAGLGNDEEGRGLWKKLIGYHRRSLAETAMYRFKTLFGGNLAAREKRRQRAELYAKSLVMNRMTRLGMPKGYWLDE